LRREPGGERGERVGAGIELALPGEPAQRVVDLAGGAVVAAVQRTLDDEPGAEAGADRDEDEVVDAARHASPLLAECGQVDVVVQEDRDPEPLLELAPEAKALEA